MQFHTSDDGRVFDIVNTLENLMHTGTEFVSEISAATIFTSFNFHIFRFSPFRFSGKGEVDVYRMRMCMCFIVLIPCHGIRLSRHQPTRHQETITPPTNSPSNKVAEVNDGCSKRSSLACLYACKLHVVGDVI